MTCRTLQERCARPAVPGQHLCEGHLAEARAAIAATLPPPGVQLVCAICGEKPTKLEAKYSAREGGTHYRSAQHGVGIPGSVDKTIARPCGPWIRQDATPEQREQAIATYRAQRAEVA